MTTIDLNKPIIRGFITAISATLHGGYPGATWAGGAQSGVWECMRDLWCAGALTREEFQWLDSLASVSRLRASKSRHGVVAFVREDTAEGRELIAETYAEVQRRIDFEENRKAHGLQAACDMERSK